MHFGILRKSQNHTVNKLQTSLIGQIVASCRGVEKAPIIDREDGRMRRVRALEQRFEEPFSTIFVAVCYHIVQTHSVWLKEPEREP